MRHLSNPLLITVVKEKPTKSFRLSGHNHTILSALRLFANQHVVEPGQFAIVSVSSHSRQPFAQIPEKEIFLVFVVLVILGREAVDVHHLSNGWNIMMLFVPVWVDKWARQSVSCTGETQN